MMERYVLFPLKYSNTSSELCSQPPRYGLESWDEMMMDRDKRLSGSRRGQSVSSFLLPAF